MSETITQIYAVTSVETKQVIKLYTSKEVAEQSIAISYHKCPEKACEVAVTPMWVYSFPEHL